MEKLRNIYFGTIILVAIFLHTLQMAVPIVFLSFYTLNHVLYACETLLS